MPSKESHLKTACENRDLAISLISGTTPSLAWATTICFYSALHLVEAALAENNQHFDNHRDRNLFLKNTKTYQNIWKHYKPLYDHSMKARYLMDNAGSAEELIAATLGESGVRDTILNHRLRKVEKSVAKKLGGERIFCDS